MDQSGARALTRRRVLGQAAGLLSALCLPACYQAYVSVRVSGVPASTSWLQLRATLGTLRAVELYPGNAEELRFYLPADAKLQALTLVVAAIDEQQKVLARGVATLDSVGDAITHSLDVVLAPVV